MVSSYLPASILPVGSSGEELVSSFSVNLLQALSLFPIFCQADAAALYFLNPPKKYPLVSLFSSSLRSNAAPRFSGSNRLPGEKAESLTSVDILADEDRGESLNHGAGG